ncbi:hypothetical protein LEP1GSC034_1745 [Leptospira interrogans str. 2003000735]|uniref:Uncharacterized protein n=4 Tax=Leptospira interrogans TaxID=173 RepID=M6RGL1_LEPIR|nr:hypothetical protein LEP1GSC007_3706 [Leptospira interrogans serovar Bulgarica str. Mallika]EKN87551.1 hypothetical protein LEP1GSC027_3749 [Leptospira interrogans str. 2002000624]EKP20354.1 hypothetical protein LEP1GSC117_0693 [Leptospira interrogans serovar Icterohaemorrhagiae str. Verdun LP]EKP74479.1 hypothetical protein LEP1GSC173_3580 [Leptospira interrogans str. HAI1594]EKQ40210.1 hypothetical protein LEP1GSC025_2219 [Leptospira interrogans str. 2002000621]EKQ46560.1 hypothetical pro
MPRSQAILIIKFTATTTTQNAIHRKRFVERLGELSECL